MNRKLKIIENILFATGISLGIYALGTTYLRNKSLPPGVCPLENNRGLIYASIALLIFSLVFPYIAKIAAKPKEK